MPEDYLRLLTAFLGYALRDGSHRSPAVTAGTSSLPPPLQKLAAENDADQWMAQMGGRHRSPALRLLGKLQQWHQKHPGESLALAVARLVMPIELLFVQSGPSGVLRSDAHVHGGALFSFAAHMTAIVQAAVTRVEAAKGLTRSERRLAGSRNFPPLPSGLDRGLVDMVEEGLHTKAGDNGAVREWFESLPRELLGHSKPYEVRERWLRTILCAYAQSHPSSGGGFHAFDDAFHGPMPKDDTWQEVLGRVVTAPGVRRLELRLNTSPDPRSTAPAWSLPGVEVLRAVADRRLDFQGITVQFPTGIQRHRLVQPSSSPRRVATVRVDGFGEFLRALRSASDQGLAPWLNAFDISGREELSAPSWILAMLYWLIEQQAQGVSPSPSFAAHAGESYPSPLTGLRRIGETLLFPVHVTRIGHGVALSEHVNDWCGECVRIGVGATRLCDSIDDLLWCMTQPWATGRLRGAVARDLETLLDEAVLACPPLDAIGSVARWVAAYRSCFDPAMWVESHIVSDLGDELSVAWSRRSRSTPEVAAPLLLMEYLPALTQPLRELMAWRRGRIDPHSRTGYYDAGRRALLGEVIQREVAIECCPTSNVWIKSVKWFDTHPFFEFADLHLAVTINSDNPGFFSTHVALEEALLSQGARVTGGVDADVDTALASARAEGLKRTALGAPVLDPDALRYLLAV